MALSTYALPFGIRDVKVAEMTAPATYGALVDLPASRTLSFAETEDSVELRGDDVVVASHGTGKSVTWSLEGGGISLDALKVLVGGIITASGVTPNEKEILAVTGSTVRPYFKVEGQMISDSGGDLHVVIYKAKIDGDIGGEFSEGSFYLTGADGIAVPRDDGKLYDIVHNETAAAIA